MKQYVVMVLFCVLGAASGCASEAHDLEIRQLFRKVEVMQHQMVRYDKQVEELTDLLTVVRALHSGETRDGKGDLDVEGNSQVEQVEIEEVNVPKNLRVVRLVPNESVQKDSIIIGGPEVKKGESLRVSVSKVPPPPALRSIDDDAGELLFTDGLASYQKGEYANALRFFMEFKRLYDSHSRAGDTLFWLASCHFELEAYGESIKYYKQYLNRYSAGKKVVEVLLHLGLAYEKLYALNEAELVFERLVRDFPTSAITEIARSHLEDRIGGNR